MTAAELLSRREQIRDELADTSRHLITVLRDHEPELRQAPIGDVLCWTEGLDEAKVSRILTLTQVKWGKPLSKLTKRDISEVCYWINRRHPSVWEHWRELATGGNPR